MRITLNRNILIVIAGIVILSTVAWHTYYNKSMECSSNYSLKFYDKDEHDYYLSQGVMHFTLGNDKRGVALYTGNIIKVVNDVEVEKFRVNRAMEFSWLLKNGVISTTTLHTFRNLNDNSPDEAVQKYVHPGFQKNVHLYASIMDVGGGHLAGGEKNYPKTMCQQP